MGLCVVVGGWVQRYPLTIRGQGPLPHVLSDPLPHGLLEPLTVGAGLAREGQVLTPEQYEWVPTRTTKPALMGANATS